MSRQQIKQHVDPEEEEMEEVSANDLEQESSGGSPVFFPDSQLRIIDHLMPSSTPAENPESSSTTSEEQMGELCSQPTTPPVCSAGRASTPDSAASASRAQPGLRFRKRTRNTSYADYILAMHEESREDRLHRDRLMDRQVEEGQKDREQESTIRQQEMANRKADAGSMRLIARQHKRIADSFAKLVDVMAARK